MHRTYLLLLWITAVLLCTTRTPAVAVPFTYGQNLVLGGVASDTDALDAWDDEDGGDYAKCGIKSVDFRNNPLGNTYFSTSSEDDVRCRLVQYIDVAFASTPATVYFNATLAGWYDDESYLTVKQLECDSASVLDGGSIGPITRFGAIVLKVGNVSATMKLRTNVCRLMVVFIATDDSNSANYGAQAYGTSFNVVIERGTHTVSPSIAATDSATRASPSQSHEPSDSVTGRSATFVGSLSASPMATSTPSSSSTTSRTVPSVAATTTPSIATSSEGTSSVAPTQCTNHTSRTTSMRSTRSSIRSASNSYSAVKMSSSVGSSTNSTSESMPSRTLSHASASHSRQTSTHSNTATRSMSPSATTLSLSATSGAATATSNDTQTVPVSIATSISDATPETRSESVYTRLSVAVSLSDTRSASNTVQSRSTSMTHRIVRRSTTATLQLRPPPRAATSTPSMRRESHPVGPSRTATLHDDGGTPPPELPSVDAAGKVVVASATAAAGLLAASAAGSAISQATLSASSCSVLAANSDAYSNVEDNPSLYFVSPFVGHPYAMVWGNAGLVLAVFGLNVLLVLAARAYRHCATRDAMVSVRFPRVSILFAHLAVQGIQLGGWQLFWHAVRGEHEGSSAGGQVGCVVCWVLSMVVSAACPVLVLRIRAVLLDGPTSSSGGLATAVGGGARIQGLPVDYAVLFPARGAWCHALCRALGPRSFWAPSQHRLMFGPSFNEFTDTSVRQPGWYLVDCWGVPLVAAIASSAKPPDAYRSGVCNGIMLTATVLLLVAGAALVRYAPYRLRVRNLLKALVLVWMALTCLFSCPATTMAMTTDDAASLLASIGILQSATIAVLVATECAVFVLVTRPFLQTAEGHGGRGGAMGSAFDHCDDDGNYEMLMESLDANGDGALKDIVSDDGRTTPPPSAGSLFPEAELSTNALRPTSPLSGDDRSTSVSVAELRGGPLERDCELLQHYRLAQGGALQDDGAF